jgi:hypothetical protein
MVDGALLGLDFLGATLDVGGEILSLHAGDKQRGVGEEVVHLFEGTPGCLGQEAVEEESVGEVANLEI